MRKKIVFHNGSEIIYNKFLLKQKNFLSNLSKIKNDNTNYTGSFLLNNSQSYLNSTKSVIYKDYPAKTKPIKIIKRNLINCASDIIRQRLNHQISQKNFFYNSKRKKINISKDISLNNYLIDLIKKKRIDINNKEKKINKSLKVNSERLIKKHNSLLSSINKKKEKKRKEEEKITNDKIKYDNILNKYIDEVKENQNLNINLKRIIILINQYRKYASFLHEIGETPFIYDEVDELNNKRNNYEEIAEKYIKIYENNKNIYENKSVNFLEFENLLMRKYSYYEGKMINAINDEEKIRKENEDFLKKYKIEIKLLNEKIQIYKQELNELNKIKMNSLIPLGNIFNNNINNNISNNIYNKEEKLINEYEKYINDIGKLLGVEFRKEIKEKQIKDYFLYCKDIAKCLETIEKDVNKYISQIEVLISNDKDLIMKSIRNIREENKAKKKLNAEKQRLENDKLNIYKSYRKNTKIGH